MSDAILCDLCEKKVSSAQVQGDYWLLQLNKETANGTQRKPAMHICVACMQHGIALKDGILPKSVIEPKT